MTEVENAGKSRLFRCVNFKLGEKEEPIAAAEDLLRFLSEL